MQKSKYNIDKHTIQNLRDVEAKLPRAAFSVVATPSEFIERLTPRRNASTDSLGAKESLFRVEDERVIVCASKKSIRIALIAQLQGCLCDGIVALHVVESARHHFFASSA